MTLWIRYLPHILVIIGITALGMWANHWTRENARAPLRLETEQLRVELAITRAQFKQASDQAREAGERYAADVKTREDRWAAKAKEDEDAVAQFEQELQRTRVVFDQRLRNAIARTRNTVCATGVQVSKDTAAQARASEGRGVLEQESDRRLREFEQRIGEIRDAAMRESQKLHSCQQRYWAIESELEAFRQGISR